MLLVTWNVNSLNVRLPRVLELLAEQRMRTSWLAQSGSPHCVQTRTRASASGSQGTNRAPRRSVGKTAAPRPSAEVAGQRIMRRALPRTSGSQAMLPSP